MNIQGMLTNVTPGRSRWVTTEDAALRVRGLSPRALQRALAFMEANLGKRLTLGEIASSAAVSRFHFARLFRVTTGHSPMDFLMRARITRSKQLLEGGRASICAVAAALGFCDQSHFTRTFRRITGMAPREYLRALSVSPANRDDSSAESVGHADAYRMSIPRSASHDIASQPVPLIKSNTSAALAALFTQAGY